MAVKEMEHRHVIQDVTLFVLDGGSGDGLGGLLFLIRQRVALHAKALQDRHRDGLFLAQGGQRFFALGPQLGGGAGGALGLRRGGGTTPIQATTT